LDGKACSAKFYVTKKRTREEALDLAKKIRLKKEKEVLASWKKAATEMIKADKERVKAMLKAAKEK